MNTRIRAVTYPHRHSSRCRYVGDARSRHACKLTLVLSLAAPATQLAGVYSGLFRMKDGGGMRACSEGGISEGTQMTTLTEKTMCLSNWMLKIVTFVYDDGTRNFAGAFSALSAVAVVDNDEKGNCGEYASAEPLLALKAGPLDDIDVAYVWGVFALEKWMINGLLHADITFLSLSVFTCMNGTRFPVFADATLHGTLSVALTVLPVMRRLYMARWSR